jgi:hypothetical protein
MFEVVSVIIGLCSGGIFLAHAIEAYRSAAPRRA